MKKHLQIIHIFVVSFVDLALAFCVVFYEHTVKILKIIAPVCPLNAAGLKCGLCGATHSAVALLNGDYVTAFKENLLLPFYAAAIPVLLAVLNIAVFGKRSALLKRAVSVKSFLMLTVPIITYMAVRNIFILLSKI